jgi:sec-independent protein translocase protein TatA
MPNLGPMEIILIVLVILVFFGAKKIPELAQGLGKGIREFKKATQATEEETKPSESKRVEEHATKKEE